MVPTLCPRRGIRPCACGNCPLARPPAPSSATPATSSPCPSLPTIDRSCRVPVTERSSCGTPWATASTPSPTRATPSGFPACDSARTRRTRSSSRLAGTSSLRYVLCFFQLKSNPLAQMMFCYVFATSEPFAAMRPTNHHISDSNIVYKKLLNWSNYCWTVC